MRIFFKNLFRGYNFFRFFSKEHALLSLFLAVSYRTPFKNESQYPIALNRNAEQEEEIDDVILKFSETFLKNLVINGLFHSNQMINEGSVFVELLAEQEILQKAVTMMLLNNLKTKEFKESGLAFSKIIVSDLVAVDKSNPNSEETPLEKDLNYLILRTLRDPELKIELLDVLKWLLDRPEIKEGLIDLFTRAVTTDERVKKAVTNALKMAFFEILMNKLTVEKMKAFSLNVLAMESKDDEGTVKKLVRLFQERFTASQKKQKKGDSPPVDQEKEEIREFFFFSP